MTNQELPGIDWGEPLTAENITSVEPIDGFPSNTTGERFRPFGFRVLDDGTLIVETLNLACEYTPVNIDRIPGITPVYLQYITAPVTTAPVVRLHYDSYPTDGSSLATNVQAPLLAINSEPTEEVGMPRAHFVLGEHPEHPDKGRAIYIGAVLLGHTPLDTFTPRFCRPKKRTLNYYPLPTQPQQPSQTSRRSNRFN